MKTIAQKVSWKKRSLFSSLDIHAVYSRLEELRSRNGGRLGPEDVLDDAEHKGSVFHTVFHGELGKKMVRHAMLNVARNLIGDIVFVDVSVKGEADSPPERLYLSVATPDEEGPRAYTARPEATVVEMASAVEQAMVHALGTLREFEIENEYCAKACAALRKGLELMD